ncbi:MAG: heme o synthase [Chloroflexota bacterium]
MEGLAKHDSTLPRTGARFRWLTLVTVAVVYTLIVAGGIVRVTGSGLGCPDWPLCYGRLIPPLQADAPIEYAHRLAASLASPLILITAAVAWLRYRQQRMILWPALAAVALLAFQVVLGGITVLLETPPTVVALHLGTALLILGLLIVVAMAALRPPATRLDLYAPSGRLASATLLTVFLLMVSGGLVAGAGATGSCGGWPLCDGRVWPGHLLGQVHMLHRLIAGLAGLMVLGLAWWGRRAASASLGRVLVTLSACLVAAQVAVGALNVLRGFPPTLNGLHVATAAAAWGMLTASWAALTLQPSPARATHSCEAGEGRSGWKDFLGLTRPIIVALLLVTTLAGMIVGDQGWPGWGLVLWTMAGGALAAGGASAINQYIDRDQDAHMQRTRRRPIPSGRVQPEQALTFGLVLCLASFYVLALAVNLLSAVLALAGMLYYVVLYSLVLKRTTHHNIVVGGGAGAIPPLVGWAAATGRLDFTAFLLFALIFFWTPAHFWALALLRNRDYARVGVPMLPVVRGEGEARLQVLLYTVQVVVLGLMLGALEHSGWLYLIAAATPGLALVRRAWRLWRDGGHRSAWGMYRFSSLYLALLFGALMLDTLFRA